MYGQYSQTCYSNWGKNQKKKIKKKTNKLLCMGERDERENLLQYFYIQYSKQNSIFFFTLSLGKMRKKTRIRALKLNRCAFVHLHAFKICREKSLKIVILCYFCTGNRISENNYNNDTKNENDFPFTITNFVLFQQKKLLQTLLYVPKKKTKMFYVDYGTNYIFFFHHSQAHYVTKFLQ